MGNLPGCFEELFGATPGSDKILLISPLAPDKTQATSRTSTVFTRANRTDIPGTHVFPFTTNGKYPERSVVAASVRGKRCPVVKLTTGRKISMVLEPQYLG